MIGNINKYFVLLLLCLCSIHNLFAQDKLISKSGDIYNCKITGVDTVAIYFTIYNRLGDIHTSLPRKEVQKCIFNNPNPNTADIFPKDTSVFSGRYKRPFRSEIGIGYGITGIYLSYEYYLTNKLSVALVGTVSLPIFSSMEIIQLSAKYIIREREKKQWKVGVSILALNEISFENNEVYNCSGIAPLIEYCRKKSTWGFQPNIFFQKGAEDNLVGVATYNIYWCRRIRLLTRDFRP